MHMSDALITPIVGLSTIGASGLTLRHALMQIEQEDSYEKLPLMAVMGAFVFVAQMVNFSIPFTGSSGHLAGGLLLSILLGPYAGFLTIASILVVQALVFADGGLLALGANIFNMGFMACFIAYPLIYKPIINRLKSRKGIIFATILSAIIAMELGALGVVIETVLAGKVALSFSTFLSLMLSIHLGIGFVEGLVTAIVVVYLFKVKPNLNTERNLSKSTLILMSLVILFMGFFIVQLASEQPDGLEWSLLHIGVEDTVDMMPITAIMPDYESHQNTIDDGILSSFTGASLTVFLVLGTTFVIRQRRKRKSNETI